MTAIIPCFLSALSVAVVGEGTRLDSTGIVRDVVLTLSLGFTTLTKDFTLRNVFILLLYLDSHTYVSDAANPYMTTNTD